MLAFHSRGHANRLDHLNLERFNDRVEGGVRFCHGITLFTFLTHITGTLPYSVSCFLAKGKRSRPLDATNRHQNPVSSSGLLKKAPAAFSLLGGLNVPPCTPRPPHCLRPCWTAFLNSPVPSAGFWMSIRTNLPTRKFLIIQQVFIRNFSHTIQHSAGDFPAPPPYFLNLDKPQRPYGTK